MIDCKGSHFEKAIILWGVSVVCGVLDFLPATRRDDERAGVTVDYATLNRGVIKYAPKVEKAFRAQQLLVGRSWRMDEINVRVKGQWNYLSIGRSTRRGSRLTSC